MSHCTFTLAFTGNPTTLYERALLEAKRHNAVINGNMEFGDVTVNILGNVYFGTYQLNNGSINICLKNKPFYIPCVVVQNIVAQFVGKI